MRKEVDIKEKKTIDKPETSLLMLQYSKQIQIAL
jgi:hypothetical protein